MKRTRGQRFLIGNSWQRQEMSGDVKILLKWNGFPRKLFTHVLAFHIMKWCILTCSEKLRDNISSCSAF